MPFRALPAALLATALSATSALAATTTIFFGDSDCFGTGAAVCGEGALINLGAITQGRFEADTDILITDGRPFDFKPFISLPDGDVITSATLIYKVVNLDLVDQATPPFGDAVRGAEVFLNGASLLEFNPNAGRPTSSPQIPPNEVDIITVSVDPADLDPLGGNNLFQLRPEEAFVQFDRPEDYAVDFVTLTFETEREITPPPPPPIPLPASMSVSLLGLGALLAARRLTRARG